MGISGSVQPSPTTPVTNLSSTKKKVALCYKTVPGFGGQVITEAKTKSDCEILLRERKIDGYWIATNTMGGKYQSYQC